MSSFWKVYEKLSKDQSIGFLDCMINLIQDDDEDVRLVIIDCLGKIQRLSLGFPKNSRLGLEILLNEVQELGGSNYTISRISRSRFLKAGLCS